MEYRGMKVLGLLGATTVATLVGAGEVKAIDPVALDLFEDADNTASVVAGEGRVIDNNLDSNTVVNGFRAVEVAQGTSGTTTAQVDTSRNPAEFRLVADQDNDQAVLDYRGDGVDLIQDGNTGLLFENLGGQGELTVKLTDTSGDSSQANGNWIPPDFGGPDNLFFSFNDNFSNSINFESIESAEVTLTAINRDANPRFSAFGSVPDADSSLENPEPIPFEAETSIGLALLGAWGAWKRWKSKQQQAS